MTIREKRLYLERENRKYTDFLEEIPPSSWPRNFSEDLMHVFRSRSFLVQVFREKQGFRLSVNRTQIKPGSEEWDDQIHWEELQKIKRECGYGDFYAIEIYPRDRDTVNVANMRHLWILVEPLSIGWFAGVCA